ncbi:MAG: hemolysin family protein, partial [Actinomycetota bacterium]|nr:hemolysin family protein [Actinomycetota bacterium]
VPATAGPGGRVSTPEVAAVVAVVVLVASSAVLALAETSLTHLGSSKALALEEEGRRGAASLARLLAHREQVLNPVLLLVLVCHLAAGTLVGLLAQSYFGAVGIAVATGLLAVVIFVLAEAAPKTYALQHTERSALLVAPVVSILARFPPVRLLTRALIGLSNLVLPGKGRRAGPVVSEEELLALADVAVEADVIEVEERALIRSIIDFGDTVAREVMVPRPDMVTVAAGATVAQAMETVISNGYSRIPLRDEGIDDIVGLVYAKDLMRASREGRTSAIVRTLLREAHFVPESKRVAELMREMQAEKFHMAIVIDEYGSTAGVVTLEDLIEELVGEIVDEFDVEDPLLEPLPGGDVRVAARMPLDELNDLLHLDLPEGNWDTVGGLVFDLLGHVPNEGETVAVDGHVLRAERVQGRRIGRVRITRAEEAVGPDAAAS